MFSFDSNALWGIAGIIVGVISSMISYLLDRKKELLNYEMSSTTLISKETTALPQVKFLLNGKSVEELVLTTIRVVNSGNQTIVGSSFSPLNPLCITVSDCFYFSQNDGLDWSVDSKQPVILEAGSSANTMYIKFDYLKPHHSFSISVFHAGNVSITGELKNGVIRQRHQKDSTIRTLLWQLLFSMCIFLVLPVLIMCFSPSTQPNMSNYFTLLGIMFGGCLILSSIVLVILTFVEKKPSK